nr:MAG: polyprotein [Sanya iflavirus 2]
MKMSQNTNLLSLAAPAVLAGSDCVSSSSSKNSNQSHDKCYAYDIVPDTQHFREHLSGFNAFNQSMEDNEENMLSVTPIDFYYPQSSIVDIPSYDVWITGPSTPCGCLPSSMDIHTVPFTGPQLYFKFSPKWDKSISDDAYTHMHVVTEDGIKWQDDCWCPINSQSCSVCSPLFEVLSSANPDMWSLDSDEFFEYLRHRGDFYFARYSILKVRRGEVWYDTFVCLKYLGRSNRPMSYHVLYHSSIYSRRRTWIGPTVSNEIFQPFLLPGLTDQVIVNDDSPIVEPKFNNVMSLQRLSAIASSRINLVDGLSPFQFSVISEILRRELAPFKSGNGYILPLPGRCLPYETPMLPNFSEALVLTATADRDGPEMSETIVQNQQHNVDLAETTEASTSHVANVEFGILPWICDERHTYPDLTERWLRFTDFSWTTSQVAGSIILRFDLPLDAIINNQNAPNSLPWRQHAYFRSDMEIMLQLNSQPAQSGYLVMGTMYNASELTAASSRVTDVAHVLQMPHVTVAAGASNSGMLYVPWMRHFPVSPTLNSNWDYPMYYHTIFISVLAPLRTGADGPVSADCVLQVRFPNLEFYGMRNTVEVVEPTVLTATGWVRDLTEEGVEPNPGPFGTILSAIGVAKSAISTVSQVAGVVSNIAGKVGSFGSSAKNVVDSTESLLRKVCPKEDMDRPQDIREPVNFYLQQNTSLSLATGVNKVKLLQLQAENTVTHPPAFVPLDDQFSTEYVTGVFGQVDLVQWTTSQPRGATLYSFFVNPFCGKQINNNTFIPTPLGAISSYYAGYHGNMLMRLTFALSKFHSGRVYIVYSPDNQPLGDDVGALYATLLDVQDQSQYTFVIPYQVPSTFAAIHSRPRSDTINDPNNPIVELPYYGYVRIFVETQLRVMETASPTIDIVVEVAASPDFALQLPCGSPLRNFASTTPAILEATGLEGTPVEAEIDQADERTKVVDASTPLKRVYPAWMLNLNETYDIRDVVKRYQTWFEAATPEFNLEQFNFTNVSVYHSPLSSVAQDSPIITPAFTLINVTGDQGYLLSIQGSSNLVARERINLSTNNTISFRVPWTTNASVLSNGIDPTIRFNQLPAYCNGRIHVVLETSVRIYGISWDVTLGSAAQRPAGFRPDLITTLHDSFRFSKSDFNYQLDFRVFRAPASPNTGVLSMRVYRAMGDGGNFYLFQGFPSYNNIIVPGLNLVGGATLPSGTSGISRLRNPTFSTPRVKVSKRGLVIRPDPVRDLTRDGDVESNPGPGDVESNEPQPGPSRPDQDSEYFSTEETEYLGRAGVFLTFYNRVSSYLKTARGMSATAVSEWWRLYNAKKESLSEVLQSVRKVADFVEIVERSESNSNVRGFLESFKSIAGTAERLNDMYDRATDNGKVPAELVSAEVILKYSTFVVNVWQSNSIYQTLLNIVALFSEMGICRIVATKILDYFSISATADDDDDELSKGWVSLVITSVLAALGLSSAYVKGTDLGASLLKECREYFRTGFNVKKFLDAHFKCLGQLWAWVKVNVFGGEEAPSTEGLSVDLIEWMEKVHTLTEVYNWEYLLSNPNFANRVLELQAQSGRFDIQFAQTNRPPPAMYSVNKGRLQRAVDALGKQGGLRRNKCSPYCVYLYGDSGVGKSHISDEILIEVGHALGVRSDDPIYYRSLDVEYWNGYNQQKLISIQDFAKISTGENYRKHVAEISSLIEPFPVNPPFAELEDKKRMVDAVAILVTSNHAFPPVSNIGMERSSLFYRRRHALVKVQFKPSVILEYAAKGIALEEMIQNQKVYFPSRILASDRAEKGEHFYLEFGIHKNGIDEVPPSTFVDFSTLVTKLRESAIEFRSQQLQSLEAKEVLYRRLQPEHQISGTEFPEVIRLQATGDPPEQVPGQSLTDCDLFEEPDGLPQNHFISGRCEVTAKATGSRHCDCSAEVTQGGYTKRYCREHYKGPDRTIRPGDAERLNDERDPEWSLGGVYVSTWDETLPINPGQSKWPADIITKLDEVFTDTLPRGYVHWHRLTASCAHNSRVLSRAYFEVVNGKVEVVVNYTGIRFGAHSYDLKVIIPPTCTVSMIKYTRRVVMPGQTIDVPEHNMAVGGFRFPKCKCDISKPFQGFLIEGDVVRVVARGTLFNIRDPETQAVLLNQVLGKPGVVMKDVFNTYFAYARKNQTYWEAYGRQTVSACTDVVTLLFPIARLGVTMWAAVKVYQYVVSMFKIQANASQSGDVRRTDRVKNPAMKFTTPKATLVSLQAAGDEKISAMSNNFCELKKGTLSMWGLRLCHDFVLLPYHLLVAKGDLRLRTLYNGVYSNTIVYKEEEIMVAQLQGEVNPLDLAVVRLSGLTAGRNIVNYFCKNMEAASLRSESHWIKPIEDRVVWGPTEISPFYETVEYNNTGLNSMRTELLGFSMNNGGHAHRCGTMIMSNDVLCGVVVAAKMLTGKSFAVSVSREMIVEALRCLGATDYDMKLKRQDPPVIDGEPKMEAPEEGDFIPLGRAEQGVTYSGKTQLVKSVLHGKISEPFRQPAAQRLEATGDRLGFDVVMEGCRKQFNRPLTIDLEEVSAISKYLIERIVPNSPPVRVTSEAPMDIQTAIIGVPGTSYTPMKLNTAIGWPLMNRFPKGYKKKDIIKIDDSRTEVSIHRIALEDYTIANQLRRSGQCANSVFMDFPKDELLKPGKATRLINGAPLHHTIDMRRYCGEFLESLVKLDNKIAVGIDVHSSEWAEVHGGHNDVINEDYKSFGPGFHSQWLDVIAELIVAWTRRYKTSNPEYENVVRCLLAEAKNAVHIAGDLVYQAMCGSPSGAYGTDRINSLANLCYHCLCYLRKYGTLVGFWQHYLIVYGDDTRRVGTAYSYEEFRDCMQSIGITVELEKGGNTFLKREFATYSYRGQVTLLAPLPLPIVGDIVNWIRKPYFDAVSAVEQSVDSYLSEMFHHGQDRFDKARSQILEHLGSWGRNPELKDFNTLWCEKYGKLGVVPPGGHGNERGEILKHAMSTLLSPTK